jgi:hypothetical protein
MNLTIVALNSTFKAGRFPASTVLPRHFVSSRLKNILALIYEAALLDSHRTTTFSVCRSYRITVPMPSFQVFAFIVVAAVVVARPAVICCQSAYLVGFVPVTTNVKKSLKKNAVDVKVLVFARRVDQVITSNV